MEGLEELLGGDELLFWVAQYELHRPDGKLFIHVCELQAGPKRGMCLAYPTLIVRSGDRRFLGAGENIEEALKDCLNKIKGVPLNEIMPPG